MKKTVFALPFGLAALLVLFNAPASAQTGRPQKSTVQIRFIDSATGYAIEPESISARPHQSQDGEQRFSNSQGIQKGRASIGLERGRHTITTMSPNYLPMSGELEVKENSPYQIHFYLDPIEKPLELQPDYITTLLRDELMLIQGFIVDEESGEPLRNVRVSSQPSGAKTSSDERGFFRFYLPVSTEPDSETANLIFEKPGYKGEEREHLELWSRGDSTYNLRLERGSGRQNVDERTLRRRAATSNIEHRTSNIEQSKTDIESTSVPDAQLSGVKQLMVSDEVQLAATANSNATVRVPRNIRVLKNDIVHYVSIQYYAERVLPAEWIASWGNYTGGSNCLSAGAVVVRSYAINKINNAGASSDYDICGTSSCQVFNPTLTHSKTTKAVEFTENYVIITSSGNIASTEYSAENNSMTSSCGDGFTAPTGGCLYDPICAGESRFGHGRGLCQWGSARWATGRKMAGRNSGDGTPNGFPLRDWIWMLQHYYPSQTLVKGASLVIGDDIKARTTLNVRSCPGGEITNGVSCALITTKSTGQTGVIIGGPTVVTNDGKGFTWYQIQWNDGGPTIGWSAENYLERVFSAPTAPSGLVATAVSTNRINLNWSDTSEVEAAFKIERAPATGGPWIQIGVVEANVTSYSDTNLFPDNQWFYRVRAYNAGGDTAYTSVANATTHRVAPVLAAISNKTITDGALLIFTNIASAPDRVQLITDFEAFLSETANGVVLFRTPKFSPSTTNFLDTSAAVDIAAVRDTYPSGHSAGNVLLVTAQFTNASNPWLRLTTADAAAFPNPVIDFTKKLRFNIYSDKSIRVALGCRETSTASGTAIGANGGTSGAIEWAGVTNASGTAPMPNRTVAAGTWTSLTFNFTNEPIRNFSSGNGVLSTASGLGVLEHVAIVPNEGVGLYKIYVDDFAVLTTRTLTYNLGAGAPSGASVNPSTGVFTWTPTQAQAPSTNVISVIVTDNGAPALSATNTFTVVVNESQSPISITSQPENATVAVGSNATFNVVATGDGLQYQWRWNGDILSGKTDSTLTLNNVQFTNAGSYSVVVSNFSYSVISDSASLTVLEPVAITIQPLTRTNNIWDNASFSVTATGSGELSYQWRLDGINIEGATDSALNFTITATNSAGTYTVAVSNPVGTNISSGAGLFIPYGGWERITQWDFNSTTPDANTATGVLTPSYGSGTGSWPLMTLNNWLEGSSSDPASLGTDNSGRSLQGPSSTRANKTAGAQFAVSTEGFKNIVVTWEQRAASKNCAYWRGQYSTNGNDWVDRIVVDKRTAFVALGGSTYTFHSDDLSDIEGAANNPNFAYRIVGEHESTATGSGSAAYVPTDPNETYNNTGQARWDMVTFLGTPLNPPVIVESPLSLEVTVGETAIFTAIASGEVSAVIWTRDGFPLGSGDISTEDGITTSTLMLENIQMGDAGIYMATFFNADTPEGAASDSATLTVFNPPIITSQSADVSTNVGATVIFAVTATGTGTLNYQWRLNETNDLADEGIISGATSATLTIAGVSIANKGSYSVLISDDLGFVISSNAILTLLGGPQITNQSPNFGSLHQGDSATFQVFATGDDLFYQWYFGGTPISGATYSSYTRTNLQPSDAGVNFTVVVSNEADSVTSDPRKIGLVIPDTTRPTVTVLTPKSKSTTPQPLINVTGIVKDGKGLFLGSGIVTGVTVVHNAGLPGGSTNSAILTDFSTATLGKFNFTSPITLSPGTNTLHVYAVDMAGNQSTNLTPFFFYYDTIDTVSLVVSSGGQVKMGATTWHSSTTNNLSIFKVGRSYSLDAFVGKGTNYVFGNWVTLPQDEGFAATNWIQKSRLTFIVQSNMTIYANFIANPFTPVAGTYNGLFYEPTNVMSHASSGFVTLKVKDKSAYTGTLNFDGDKVAFSGKFTASGNVTRTVDRSKIGKSPLDLSLTIDWNTSNDQVIGTVSDGVWTAELTALKAVLSNTNSVGNYTVLVPRDSETGYPANAPGGIGSGFITNDPRGFAKISLTVGDVDKTQKATFKTSLSKDGEWPIYVPLYQSTTTYTNTYLGNIVSTKKEYLGAALGWVTFASSNAAPVCTDLIWIKKTIPNSANYVLTKPTNRFFYATGFSNQVALLASPYKMPSASEPPINFASAQVVLSDGNLAEPVTNMTTLIAVNKVTLSATNTIGTTNKMTITFNKKLGTFTGNFLRPSDGLKTDFLGVLLQNTTNASGHFLGTNQSGSVILTGN